ncbi:hypothetical protein Syun_018249 [Stephania yunnanensis]|uniref:peroxidase n=1 Tax=Stephania yunnanensis TaxID=152371 RepID=A0AAP0ITU1_9MAGN
MVMYRFLGFFILTGLVLSGARFYADGLSMGYYIMRCPMADNIVKSTVNNAFRSDPSLAAGLLRMHFHDCFVEGVVSCADILAMAARDAVFFAGGPYYEIPKGRKDGRRSKIEDTIRLPAPFLNSTELIRSFGQRGFNAQEMVALSGAHTLGVARCSSFKNRLKNFDSTNDVDPALDSNFAKTLQNTCSAGDKTEVAFDATSNSFDNAYYNALQRKAGLLTSDQTLFTNPRTRNIVNAYAMNQAMFFLDFNPVMVKMGLLDVKEGNNGEVRQDCRKIN